MIRTTVGSLAILITLLIGAVFKDFLWHCKICFAWSWKSKLLSVRVGYHEFHTFCTTYLDIGSWRTGQRPFTGFIPG